MSAIVVRRPYAFMGTGRRLTILDVSKPAVPRVTGRTEPFASAVRDLVVAGSLAYVAAGGVYIVDVSDPSEPSVVRSYPLSRLAERGGATGIAIDDDTLYIANGHLVVLDVSDPRNPIQLGEEPGTGFIDSDSRVVASGQSLYLAGDCCGGGRRNGARIRMLDVSDPSNPFQVDQTPSAIDSGAPAVVLSQGYMYEGVAGYGWGAGQGALRIFRPTGDELNRIAEMSMGPVTGVAVAGSIAYVAREAGTGEDFVSAVDVTHPEHPVVVGSSAPMQSPSALTVDGPSLYALTFDGLHILDISSPTAPVEVGRYEDLTRGTRLAVRGRYAAVVQSEYLPRALSAGALWIYDIEDPKSPQPVGHLSLNRPGAVALCEGYALVGSNAPDPRKPDQAGVFVIDLVDPSLPKVVSTIPSEIPRTTACQGNLAFMIGGNDSIVSLDLTDRSNPIQAEQIPGPMGNPGGQDVPWFGLAINGQYLYIAANEEPEAGSGGTARGKLLVFDASDIRHMVRVASVPSTQSADSIIIHGGYAYAAGSQFRAFDVSDPRLPREVGHFDGFPCGVQALTMCAGFSDMTIEDGVAYGLNQWLGLVFLDVSNPGAPGYVPSARLMLNSNNGIAAISGSLYVAGDGGLLVYQLHDRELP